MIDASHLITVTCDSMEITFHMHEAIGGQVCMQLYGINLMSFLLQGSSIGGNNEYSISLGVFLVNQFHFY